jgi:hypothetical protein
MPLHQADLKMILNNGKMASANIKRYNMTILKEEKN